MDLVLYGWIKVWKKWINFYMFFCERLIVCWWQEWHSHFEMSSRFIDRHLKFKMAWFWLGIWEVFVHHYWYKRHTGNDLICPLCRVAQETELEFVQCCPVLRASRIRVKFVPSEFYKFPSLFWLSLLLASTNENIVRSLSVYLYKAFKFKFQVHNSSKLSLWAHSQVHHSLMVSRS